MNKPFENFKTKLLTNSKIDKVLMSGLSDAFEVFFNAGVDYQHSLQEAVEVRKVDCIAFYKWWSRQPGEDIAQGYDEWKAEQSDLIGGLACCPCGQQPKTLIIEESITCKYALVLANCCNDWMIEFQTNYKVIGSEACMQLAIAAWNSAPRAS